MFNILKKTLFFVAHCRILIGVHPAAVNAPAIIIFPLLPGQLNCGFAGLMTCRLQEKHSEITADRTLADMWEKVKSVGLQTVIAEENTAANYLNGAETIHALDMAVTQLKQEGAQELLFFKKDRAVDLSRVTGEMKNYLTDEEKLLEDQAAAVINSVDLEIINSRLILLKDICWTLERDILANLQKVLSLSGAMNFSTVPPATFQKYRKLNLLLNALDRLEVRGRDSAGIQLTFILKNEKDLQEIIRQIQENGWAEDYQRRI